MNIDFSYSKPVELIYYLIKITQKNSSIKVLDFFAGSGTTLHAVMLLNDDDKGKRECILCTNNENNICENVTYKRNCLVINGYTKPDGEKVAGLSDNNLRYYRTDFIDRRHTPRNMRLLMHLATDMICIKENLYTEHDEFHGLSATDNYFRYFADNTKQMLVIYNEDIIYDIIEVIERIEVAKPIIVYVFSPGNDAWNSEFDNISEKVNLTALPAAIYNAYKRVLPKPQDTFTNEKGDNL